MSHYLTAAERRFALTTWVDQNLTVISKSGPEWVCVCPRCGRWKLALHVGKRAFHCLSAHCGWRSRSPIDLVAGTLGIANYQAYEIVNAFNAGVELGPLGQLDGESAIVRSARDIPAAPLPPVDWTLHPPQAAYVRSRGISDEHARYFGLATVFGDGLGGRVDRLLAGRVLFPVWGPTGRLIFWAARDIRSDSTIKILNTPRPCRDPTHGEYCACYHAEWGLPEVPRSATADEVVLGQHLVRPGDSVVVVEGPVDAAVCGPGFVATLRAWASPAQATLIASTGAAEAIVLYDGDEAGAKGALKAASVLSRYLPTRVAACPPGTDPGSLGRDESLRLAHAAPREGGVRGLTSQGYKSVDAVKAAHPMIPKLT